jgi:hypothetical protein
MGSVRAGSVPQRSRTGISGHQRSPTVQRNRRSLAVQLKKLGRCKQAIRIVVPKVIERRGAVLTYRRPESFHGPCSRQPKCSDHRRSNERGRAAPRNLERS